MSRLGFGAFLAPHHPVVEHPMLQFRRDLDLVTHLDKLGYDEFWCGEHHSSGWEMIASPEMFLAAAAENTKRIKLATGVVSLPYHHPFNVAQRMVQLDWMSGGRAIFGSGPGALASDAHALGIDPTRRRFMAIKSRVHWRAGLGDLAREVVECAGVGVTTSDYSLLKFERVRRPVFPLDAI
jgi:limonene 1,2-monooxygenase